MGRPVSGSVGDVDADGPALAEGRELGRHEGIGAVLVDGVLVAHDRGDLADRPSRRTGTPVTDQERPERRGRFGSGTTGTTPSGLGSGQGSSGTSSRVQRTDEVSSASSPGRAGRS